MRRPLAIRLHLALSLLASLVLSVAAAGCQQGDGERCQLDSDCTSTHCVLRTGESAQQGGTCQPGSNVSTQPDLNTGDQAVTPPDMTGTGDMVMPPPDMLIAPAGDMPMAPPDMALAVDLSLPDLAGVDLTSDSGK